MTVVASPEPPRQAAGYRLYTVGQLTLGTFLATPLVGFWLASRNFRFLGDRRREIRCRWYAVGLTVLNFVIAFAAPERLPSVAIWLPFYLTTKCAGEYWFNAALREHLRHGGRIQSWGKTIGWSVLGLVGIVAAVGVPLFALSELAPEAFNSLFAD